MSRLTFPALLLVIATLMLTGPLAAQPPAGGPNTPTDSPQGPASTHSNATTAAPDRPDADAVGWLEISGMLEEGPQPVAWAAEDDDQSLRTVMQKLDHVARSEEIGGVVVYLDQPLLTLSQVYGISEGIRAVQAAGKPVIAFAEQYGLLSYLLACEADRIVLQKHGRLLLHGLGMEEMYVAGLLEKLGAEADFVQIGDYKGAVETLTRRSPSPEWNENFDRVLDDLYAQVRERIAVSRGLSEAEVERAIGDSWAMSDSDYVSRKLVDRLSERDLTEVTARHFGTSFAWNQTLGVERSAAGGGNPLALFQTLFQGSQSRVRRPSVAVLHASGPITSGESQAGSPGAGPLAGRSIGSRTLVRELTWARDTELVKGVVLRIDSPGGSALASEVIWQAARDFSEHKPLVVSIGDTAASGGYYLASAGQTIYVPPGALVGSIGVVGGKIVLGDLYEKIGVSTHRRSRGPLADMFNSTQRFNDTQRDALRHVFQQTYDQFLDRVRQGRGDRLPDAEAVAAGRLFTGRQAVLNGMADQLGGLRQAVTDLAERIGLEPGEYDVVHRPPPMTFAEFLDSLGGPMRLDGAMGLAAVRRVLGERAWAAAAPVLQGLLLLRDEPVLTLTPRAVLVR